MAPALSCLLAIQSATAELGCGIAWRASCTGPEWLAAMLGVGLGDDSSSPADADECGMGGC